MHCVQAGTAECRQDRKGLCCHTVYDMRWSAMTWMSTLDSDMHGIEELVVCPHFVWRHNSYSHVAVHVNSYVESQCTEWTDRGRTLACSRTATTFSATSASTAIVAM